MSDTLAERPVCEVSDLDSDGVPVDLLGHVLSWMKLQNMANLQWSVFDLDWIQMPDGILQWDSVRDRSCERPNGLQLDDNGIRLFHGQAVQVIDGLFLAAEQHITISGGDSIGAAVFRSVVALRAFDSTFWRISCHDERAADEILRGFKRVVYAGMRVDGVLGNFPTCQTGCRPYRPVRLGGTGNE
jgi:hypothetical protein